MVHRLGSLLLLTLLHAGGALVSPFSQKVAIAGRGWMPFLVAQVTRAVPAMAWPSHSGFI
jgi:hypothetical protein